MIDRSLNYGRDHIERFIGRLPDATAILDIGAGRGIDLDCARRALPSARLYALEAHLPNVEQLSAKGVEVHALDIERERFPWPPGSMDIVVANQILEHTKELFWIFDQVATVLRPGGHFIVGVPNLASLHNRLLLLLGRQPTSLKNHSAHVRGFTRRDLLEFVDRCFPRGFRLRGFRGSNFYPFPAFLARPLAAASPNLAWSIFLDLEKVGEYHGEFLRYPVEQRLETNFYVGTSAAT